MNPVTYTPEGNLQKIEAIGAKPNAAASLPVAPTALPASPSTFRQVFQTTDQMKTEFVKFLKTIFFQLDEKKVLQEMEKLLADPNKTDEEIYKHLQSNINALKKSNAFLHRLWSLFVLKAGMGKQGAELMKGFNAKEFHNYLEVYDRRYAKTLRSYAHLPLDGKVVAVCDNPKVEFGDRLQAGAILSSFPYKQHVSLNDADCQDPLSQPEKTHKPIPAEEVQDQSIDLIGCLGGLHHVPADRMDAFADSLQRTLKPGGVILFRDHDVVTPELKSIASLVHTFVNIAGDVSWEVESKEVREFKSMDEWTRIMERHGFTRISPKSLVLKDDPTANAMTAFVKTPKTVDELKAAINYRSDCTRPKEGTRATWIEWGNVRSSKQYAQFIQNHHSYAFDYIGHMRQHWKHFYHFVKETLNDKDADKKISMQFDNLAMNLFILNTATIQLGIGALSSLPSAAMARWKHGENWREVCDLSALEKFEAQTELEYSNFIDHTPFYSFDYLGKIKEMWKTVAKAQEPITTKVSSFLGAAVSSVGFLAKAAISAPIRNFYTSEANVEPDTVKILVKDPNNELDGVIERWEMTKGPHDKNLKMEVLFSTTDGHKLVSVPRYRPFTEICKEVAKTSQLSIVEIGGQSQVSVDVIMQKETGAPRIEGARFIYEMDRLQDPERKKYVTYQVNLVALKNFLRQTNVEYIHE